MIKLSDLPTDVNGIIQGAWRLVHVDPNYNGMMGIVRLEHGVAVEPVAGRPLRLIVAEYGSKLFLELWREPLPPHYHLPELVQQLVPDEKLEGIELAPWRAQIADAIEPLTLEIIRFAAAYERDEKETVESFAEMLRTIPSTPPAATLEVRTNLADLRAKLASDGYVEIPKALDGCIQQLDAIIAAAPMTPPAEPPKGDGESADPDATEPNGAGADDLEKARIAAAELVASLVAMKAPELIPLIEKHESPAILAAVRDLETKERARTTVLAAIDKRIAELNKTAEQPPAEPPKDPAAS